LGGNGTRARRSPREILKLGQVGLDQRWPGRRPERECRTAGVQDHRHRRCPCHFDQLCVRVGGDAAGQAPGQHRRLALIQSSLEASDKLRELARLNHWPGLVEQCRLLTGRVDHGQRPPRRTGNGSERQLDARSSQQLDQLGPGAPAGQSR
jgi:hypothetical protein